MITPPAVLKRIISQQTGCTTPESSKIFKLMAIKVKLEDDDLKGALYDILEMLVRQSDIPAVGGVDDLTKLLSTECGESGCIRDIIKR